MKIENKLVLVTGACGGLGRPIADLFLDSGAKVIAADYDQQALEALPAGFERVLMDVTDPISVDKAVENISQEFGAIDVLINCAGSIISAPFVNILNPEDLMLPYERFRRDMQINLDSVFIVTAAVVNQMVRKRKKGCIINISSISARGNEGQTSYAAAKAAVEAMTKTWAKELGRLGMRCNAIAPGFIDTPSTHAALRSSQIKHITQSTPLGRLGKPAEIAMAALSLVENDFINGAILDVNGGLTF